MSSRSEERHTSDAEYERSEKDFWDKLEIITRPVSALLTAVIIAIIGYFGQSTITEISLQDQNARLYTELLARREDAESSLRKDMFKEIMGGFFDIEESKDPVNSLSKQVLKLELLAINFGDSLSLGPLFSEMSKDIERSLERRAGEIADWQTVAASYQKRLRSLAKRVASAQLSTIFPGGQPFSFEAPLDSIGEVAESGITDDYLYTWPFDDDNYQYAGANTIELEGIKREFEIGFRNANYAKKSVQVKVDIYEYMDQTFEEDDGSVITVFGPVKVADQEFTLDFFNFPLIDNTRLSHNQRFTLVLEDFDVNTIRLAGMVFPGLYASQRDKPFLNEAIQELGEQRESEQQEVVTNE